MTITPGERERAVGQARAFRMLLAHLQDDAAGSIDGVARVALEFDGDRGAALDVILVLLQMLTTEIDDHEGRGAWEVFLSARLAVLLDSLAPGDRTEINEFIRQLAVTDDVLGVLAAEDEDE